MNKLSSSDRSSLIRLASSLPAGDQTRKAILAGLQKTSSLTLPKSVLQRLKGGGLAVTRGLYEITSLVPGEDMLKGPKGPFGGVPEFLPGQLRFVSKSDAQKVRDTMIAVGASPTGSAPLSSLWLAPAMVYFINVGKGTKFPDDVLISVSPSASTMGFLDKLVGVGWGKR